MSFSLLFGPSQRGVAATMPSADCCVPRPWPLDSGCFLQSGFTALPGYCAITSPFITATSTSRLSGQVSDFSDSCRLVSIAVPCMWFLFIGATFCLRLPSDSASRQTPLACSYASPCRVRVDLNHQVIAPCRAHTKTKRRNPALRIEGEDGQRAYFSTQRTASIKSSRAEARPSFWRMFALWASTVLALRPSFSAME